MFLEFQENGWVAVNHLVLLLASFEQECVSRAVGDNLDNGGQL